MMDSSELRAYMDTGTRFVLVQMRTHELQSDFKNGHIERESEEQRFVHSSLDLHRVLAYYSMTQVF